MRLFEHIFFSRSTCSRPIGSREAMAAVLLVLMAVDGDLPSDTQLVLRNSLRRVRSFHPLTNRELDAMLKRLQRLLRREGGAEVLSRAAVEMDAAAREMVFALGAELIVRGPNIGREEMVRLDMVRQTLNINGRVAAEILEIVFAQLEPSRG